MSHLTHSSRRLSAAAVVLVGALALSACSGVAEPEQPEPELSPQEKLEQDAGVSIEPGLASCEFNNDLDAHEWDGSGEHPFGELDTAELRETEDAYEVTLTGDFFDSEIVTDDSSLQMQVSLVNHEDVVALYTEYLYGDLSQSGTVVDNTLTELHTDAELGEGIFTANFPKDAADFAGIDPNMWFASVTYMDGDEANTPMSFRCGDGRNWNWEPRE